MIKSCLFVQIHLFWASQPCQVIDHTGFGHTLGLIIEHVLGLAR